MQQKAQRSFWLFIAHSSSLNGLNLRFKLALRCAEQFSAASAHQSELRTLLFLIQLSAFAG
jgi:hypothetical protein